MLLADARDPTAAMSDRPSRRYAWLPKVSLALSAVVFGVFGLLLFVRPELLGAVGVEIARSAGAVELRAFYGGLELGLVAFFAVAVRRREWWKPALLVQILALGGVAAARLLGILIAGGGEPLLYSLMTAEVGGAAIGVVALKVCDSGL